MAYLIDSDWVIDHLEEIEEAVELLNQLADDYVDIPGLKLYSPG